MSVADGGGFSVKLLEQCHVSVPPNSTLPLTSLPLTFLDLPWLLFSPTKQPLFFFDFHHSLSHFSLYTLPNLKLSLSLTLQHYFTFAATLAVTSSKPHIAYTPQNTVSFQVAQSPDDFNTLIANHARNADAFHYLVPTLSSFHQNDNNIPLFAVQITVFPSGGGICIGLAFHNVVADGRTFNNFIKTWAAYCRSGSSLLSSMKNLPFYDRSVIVDSNGLEEVFLREWREREKVVNGCDEFRLKSSSEMVRATFLMGPIQMDNIKRWIVDSCQAQNQPLPVHLSAYVLTCAFLWVCLVKAQQIRNIKFASNSDPDLAFFGFIAGGMTRMPFDVPKMYLGNCVGFGRAAATRKELTGEDGIVVAARAIGGTIKKLDNAVLAGAEKWVSDCDVMYGSELHVVATWSPKLDLYETDFGWGKPRKIEEISIDRSREISLLESRDIEGGIEIGLALPKTQMDTFTMLFNQGLDALSSSIMH